MVIRKIHMHELVYEKLKEMILSGKYKEGDYFPPESELARQLGISRSALRGAMLLLRNIGIVEVTPGKGTIIKKITFPSTCDLVLQDIYENKDQIIELLELRTGIEIEAGCLAAERATDEQIAKLKEAYKHLEEDTRTKNNSTEAYLNFHLVLTEISGNNLFLQVMLLIVDLLRDTINQVRKDILSLSEESVIELERHEKVLIAIENRDKVKARKVIADNLEAVYNTVRSWY